jgi:hypothetical protein
MNTDDPPEWFSLMTRAEPPLAVPPMNALPSPPPTRRTRDPAPDRPPRLPGSTTVVVSDEAAVTNAGDRPQRRSLEYLPTVLIDPPSSERAF